MSEHLKDVLALVIAIVLGMLVWLPTRGGTYRLWPETEMGSRGVRSQPVPATRAASVAAEAPGLER